MSIRGTVALAFLLVALQLGCAPSVRAAMSGGGSVPISTSGWIEALRPVLRGNGATEGSIATDQKDMLAVGRPRARSPSSLFVPFERQSATLTREAEDQLDRLGAALTSDTLMPFAFRLECFPAPEPQKAVDDALFWERTDAVVQHLLNRSGVEPQRLETARKTDQPVMDPESDAEGLVVIITNLGE